MASSSAFPATPFLTFLFLTYITSLTCALDVSISFRAASGVPQISPSHVSLSIELDRWTDWAGNVSRNTFFFNTLNNLNQITGKPPNVRIGGNTMDATIFRADAQVCIGSRCTNGINHLPLDSLRKTPSLLHLRQLHIQKQTV
jgi:hypothetical protein